MPKDRFGRQLVKLERDFQNPLLLMMRSRDHPVGLGLTGEVFHQLLAAASGKGAVPLSPQLLQFYERNRLLAQAFFKHLRESLLQNRGQWIPFPMQTFYEINHRHPWGEPQRILREFADFLRCARQRLRHRRVVRVERKRPPVRNSKTQPQQQTKLKA